MSAFAAAPLSSSWLPNNDNIQKQNKNKWFLLEDAPASLPFDCTGCGKCCKVQGTVVMSHKEVVLAAKLLNISVHRFKVLYVEEEQEMPQDGSIGWVKLRDKGAADNSACIFLNDNNQCNIYEARPLQCLSYPFWPSIMASRKSWNEEVVLSGDPPEEISTINGKYWTPQKGGCEGMSIIEDPTHESFTNTSSENDGVPVQDAQVALEMYVRYRKAYPLNGTFKPIER